MSPRPTLRIAVLVIANLFLVAAPLSISGCASAGTKVEESSVSQITKGKTTKAELVAMLGAPTTASLTGDGREMLFWSHAKTQIKGSTFIPIVGMFAGGADTKLTMFQVILNKDKVVEDYLWNGSQIEARSGR